MKGRKLFTLIKKISFSREIPAVNMPHAQSIAVESPTISAKTAADWKNDLARDGYVVVKNVISEEKAAYYVDQMQEWLEGFGLGYSRSDKSTWKPGNLPANMK